MNNMALAYDLAACAVRQRYAEQHPECLDGLASLQARDVTVFSGTYDHVQEVLSRLAIPFKLDPAACSWSDSGVIFANCSSQANAALSKNVEAFVRNGGHLVSSDWALHHLVEKAFPNTVRWTGKSTGDEVVGVEPWLDSLWSEVVVLGTEPQWWLEGSSYPIAILDDSRVKVEASSHEMMVKHQAAPVAVRFEWGTGQVFHVISHFWMKRSRAPSPRHQGPAREFLEVGMNLSGPGIERVLAEVKVRPEDVNFASLQSAVTSTELIAQLCLRSGKHETVQPVAAQGQ
jgi:hypothetical protein